jgi:hypothetical protein
VNVRPKNACKACEKNGATNKIKEVPIPAYEHSPKRLCKTYLTESIDHTKIITSKYQLGLPLYQQEAMLKQYGIELSRKNNRLVDDKMYGYLTNIIRHAETKITRTTSDSCRRDQA